MALERNRSHRSRARDPVALERRMDVVRRKAAGKTYKEIAGELKISISNVARLYNQGMDYLTEEFKAEVSRFRIEEANRLEAYIQELHIERRTMIVAVKDGDPVVVDQLNLEVYDRIFKAIAQKAKILGMDIVRVEGNEIDDRAPWQQLLADVIVIGEEIKQKAAEPPALEPGDVIDVESEEVDD